MMNVDGKTRVLGLLGDPVEHTMSPLIHNTLSDILGINNMYVPFHTKTDGLKAAVEGAYALNILGLNVTVPHKNEVMKYLTELDDGGRVIGAVNTLVRTEMGYKGYNTDMMGLSRELDSYGISLQNQSVIILGAGGAAKAVAYMCMSRGAKKIYILNRTVDKAREIAVQMNHFFGRPVIEGLELLRYRDLPQEQYIVFQSTSIGLAPHADVAVIEDQTFYNMVKIGIDLIYNPFETKFMKRCKAAGAAAYNGLRMLLYQGIIAYELWNNIQVSEEAAEQIYLRLLKKTRNNIVLTGFMGCGKSTIGKALMETGNYRLLDTDVCIEERAGKRISQIFEAEGENYFRNLETETLKDLKTSVSHTILATGGGMPLREENAKELSEIGTVIYLRVEADEIIRRLAGDTVRPLLQSENPEEKVRELLAYRDPIYKKHADVVIDVTGKSIDTIVEEILKLPGIR